MTLRLDDLEVLALALDVTDRELEDQLVRLAGVSERTAADIRRRLVRRRAPTRVAALALGVLAAVPVVHVRGQHNGLQLNGGPQPTTTIAAPDAPVEIGDALTIERDGTNP